MDFKTSLLFISLLLASFANLGESSAIASPKEVPSLKEVDQTKVDDWVRLFYDRCGETDVVEFEGSCSYSGNTGPYCSKEVVKRCIGDRDGCIEEMNCYFAVAITESAVYKPYNFEPSSTSTTPATTPPLVFDKYYRNVTDYQVKVLDACHLKPSAGDQSAVPQKFVGVGFGPFNRTNPKKLDCDREPTLADFRAYFFVDDIANCMLEPGLPVYPYIYTSESNPGGSPVPDNQFELIVDQWQSSVCPTLNKYIPATADISAKQSDFMSNLLVYYYGTPEYVGNYNYTDVTNWAEIKANVTLPTYFHPLDADRELPTEPPPPSGSVVIQPSIYFSIALILWATVRSCF